MQPTIKQEDGDNTFLECTKIHQTEKAILVKGMKGAEVWLPLKSIEIVSENMDDRIEIIVPNWLIERNPLC